MAKGKGTKMCNRAMWVATAKLFCFHLKYHKVTEMARKCASDCLIPLHFWVIVSYYLSGSLLSFITPYHNFIVNPWLMRIIDHVKDVRRCCGLSCYEHLDEQRWLERKDQTVINSRWFIVRWQVARNNLWEERETANSFQHGTKCTVPSQWWMCMAYVWAIVSGTVLKFRFS